MSNLNNKIKICILEMSSQNKAILEFFFDNSGKSLFEEASLDNATAYIIDFDFPGAKESLEELNKTINIPGIIVSIKEVTLPNAVWIPKPLTTKALSEAKEQVSEIILAPPVSEPVLSSENIIQEEKPLIDDNVTITHDVSAQLNNAIAEPQPQEPEPLELEILTSPVSAPVLSPENIIQEEELLIADNVTLSHDVSAQLNDAIAEPQLQAPLETKVLTPDVISLDDNVEQSFSPELSPELIFTEETVSTNAIKETVVAKSAQLNTQQNHKKVAADIKAPELAIAGDDFSVDFSESNPSNDQIQHDEVLASATIDKKKQEDTVVPESDDDGSNDIDFLLDQLIAGEADKVETIEQNLSSSTEKAQEEELLSPNFEEALTIQDSDAISEFDFDLNSKQDSNESSHQVDLTPFDSEANISVNESNNEKGKSALEESLEILTSEEPNKDTFEFEEFLTTESSSDELLSVNSNTAETHQESHSEITLEQDAIELSTEGFSENALDLSTIDSLESDNNINTVNSDATINELEGIVQGSNEQPVDLDSLLNENAELLNIEGVTATSIEHDNDFSLDTNTAEQSISAPISETLGENPIENLVPTDAIDIGSLVDDDISPKDNNVEIPSAVTETVNEAITSKEAQDNTSKAVPELSAEEELQSLLEEIRFEAEDASPISSLTRSGQSTTRHRAPTFAEERWELTCGINKHNSDEKQSNSFNPKEHMLDTLLKVVEKAKQTNKVLRLKFQNIIIVVVAELDSIYCDLLIDSKAYAEICYNYTDQALIKVHSLDESEIRLYKKKITEKSDKINSLESFIWTTSLLTARGRLPSGTNIKNTVTLKHWPDLTRIEAIPHVMQMAAVFYKHTGSLQDIPQWLKIDKTYVYSFYNAALSLKLLELDKTKQLSSRSDGNFKKTKNRGFLSRLLKRINS